MFSIKKCIKCNKYTLMEVCNICNEKTISPHPPKFSLEKELKYEKYKRNIK